MSILLLTTCCIRAAAASYAVSDIPKALLVGADAVVRYDSASVSLTQYGFNETRKIVITILNKHGDSYATMMAEYHNFSKVAGASMRLLDADGKQIKRMEKVALVDVATNAYSGKQIDAVRSKTFSFGHRVYPYTVVIEYSRTAWASNFLFPEWRIYPGPKVSVERSVFELKTDSDDLVRHRILVPVEQMQSASVMRGKSVVKTFSVSNLKPIQVEYAVPYMSSLPRVEFVPERMVYDELRGSAADWKSLGRFFYEAYQQVEDDLPTAKALVAKLTANCKSEREKVAAIYKYVQQHCRLVTDKDTRIGWHKANLAEIHQTGLSDITGLTMYLRMLLSMAEIPSELCLLNSGEWARPVEEYFPSSVFNYALLMVPLPSDTLWVDCADKYSPPGYIGFNNQGRPALLIKSDGGILVRTPKYGHESAYYSRNLTIHLSADEGADMVMWDAEYAGPCQEILRSLLLPQAAEKDVLAQLKSKVPFKNTQVDSFRYYFSDTDYISPKIGERAVMQVHLSRSQIDGNQLVQIPFGLLLMEEIAPSAYQRRLPFVLQLDYAIHLTYRVIAPKGMVFASHPKRVEHSTAFGNYTLVSRQVSEGEYIIEAHYKQKGGTFAVRQLEHYLAFMKDVNDKLHGLTLVLIR